MINGDTYTGCHMEIYILAIPPALKNIHPVLIKIIKYGYELKKNYIIIHFSFFLFT